MPNGKSVRVQCLRCGHFNVLTPDMLSRLAIAPNIPIVAFVKHLRCRKCGSRSVLVVGYSWWRDTIFLKQSFELFRPQTLR